MVRGVEEYLNQVKVRKIIEDKKNLSPDRLTELINMRPRIEKVAIKDAKLRTFIADDEQRDDLVTHIYDVTYGTVRREEDNLVVIDDSIVRGTTLKRSILRILDRLGPKKIVIVSSAPQLRYPDCYGIDMAKLNDFVAFNAAISLLEENNLENIIDEVYEKCKVQLTLPKEQIINYVQKIYEPFTDEQISKKITQLLTPKNINADVEIIYQTVEDLHKACPNHKGDWYFTGNFPTPGGMKVSCRSFVNYIEKRNERAY
jgi:amidophosphoribosyltransferase